MSHLISRRELLKALMLLGAVGGGSLNTSSWLGARAAAAASPLSGARHNVVFVTCTGGIDHSMILPVFKGGTDHTLSPAVDFASRKTFPFYNTELFLNPSVLYPEHPMIAQYGHLLSFIDGIFMDGQNDHAAALAVMVRGRLAEGVASFAAVLGELLGQETKHALVTFGRAPYHSGVGLSPRAGGIALPKSLSTLQEMVAGDFVLDGLTQDDLDTLSVDFLKSPEGEVLKYHVSENRVRGLLRDFREFSSKADPTVKKQLLSEFSLDPNLFAPYLEITHEYGRDRHEPFALTAQMIKQGNTAACYVIPLGMLEGFNSYDTHNNFSNDVKQQAMLKMDLTALSIFLGQLGEHLNHTTVIVQSEFGRTPKLNAAGGKDHWGFNNMFLMISPLFRPGRFSLADPNDYGPLGCAYSDGSQAPLTCRGFYRGFIEMLLERQLVTATPQQIDVVLRQSFAGPKPVGLFS